MWCDDFFSLLNTLRQDEERRWGKHLLRVSLREMIMTYVCTYDTGDDGKIPTTAMFTNNSEGFFLGVRPGRGLRRDVYSQLNAREHLVDSPGLGGVL